MDKELDVEKIKKILLGETCEFCGFRDHNTCIIKNDLTIDFNDTCRDWRNLKDWENTAHTIDDVMDREG